MTDRRYVLFENIIKFSWILVLFYFIVFPTTHNNTIATLIWTLSVTATLVGCLIFIRLLENKELYAISLIIFVIVLGLLLGWDEISKEHYISAYIYISFMLSICTTSKVKISKNTFEFIIKVNMILVLVFLIYSFTPIANKQYSEGIYRDSIYFVFNLDNSNVAGIYLFCIYCINIIFFKEAKRKYIRIFLLIVLIYLIYKTNTRTCMFSAILVTVCYIFWTNRKVPTIGIIVGCLFPIVFIFIYLYMAEHGFEDIEIMGKSLFSGREEVFVIYLDHIDTFLKAVIGNYVIMPFKNGHNAPLTIFCSIGIVGFISTYYLIISNILKHNIATISKTGCMAIFSVLCCFVQSSGEAALFLGGFPGCVFMNTFFLLMAYEE